MAEENRVKLLSSIMRHTLTGNATWADVAKDLGPKVTPRAVEERFKTLRNLEPLLKKVAVTSNIEIKEKRKRGANAKNLGVEEEKGQGNKANKPNKAGGDVDKDKTLGVERLSLGNHPAAKSVGQVSEHDSPGEDDGEDELDEDSSDEEQTGKKELEDDSSDNDEV